MSMEIAHSDFDIPNSYPMLNMKPFDTVRIVRLIKSPEKYDDWGWNTQPVAVGDTGALVDVLQVEGVADGYVVENVATDGTTVWLSIFHEEEIEPVDSDLRSLPSE